MNVEELTAFALQRVTAYEGLAIDASIWTDAHSYHHTAQRLHNRMLHGSGIVAGLQPKALEPAGRGVLVEPGLAIDPSGNMVRVPQPVRMAIPPAASGVVCFVLRFVENPVDAGSGVPSCRVSEFFNLLAAPPPLKPGDVEVGRVVIADSGTVVKQAADPFAPGTGEIDTRYRRHLGVSTSDTLTIGRLNLTETGSQVLHRHGFAHLVRSLEHSAPFVVQFLGDVRIEQAVGQCDMLYICGAGPVRMTPKDGAQLAAYLKGGGVVFAEPCIEEETKRQEVGRFASTLTRVMADLKQELTPISSEHAVFAARHVFGLAPEGVGGQAALIGRENVILNPNDYGCCWQGGMTQKPLSREVIRSATEFGENIAWFASAHSTRRTLAAAEKQ